MNTKLRSSTSISARSYLLHGIVVHTYRYVRTYIVQQLHTKFVTFYIVHILLQTLILTEYCSTFICLYCVDALLVQENKLR